MDEAYLSAMAALAGSAVGGLTSFLSSWISQGSQFRSQLVLQDKGRREELYRLFVEEASKLYIDAITSNTPDLPKLFMLYAMISRMRIMSTLPVVDEAEKVARSILEAYPAPNRTFNDVRAMVSEHTLDPLRGFADACRNEFTRHPDMM